jgi:excisionase family DNA binding protein
MNTQLFLRRAEAAEFLGIHPRTLNNWTRSRLIPFAKIRHTVLFRRDDLEAAVAAWRVAPVSEPKPRRAKNGNGTPLVTKDAR